MRVALFYSDGIIANKALNALIPQMIEFGVQPVLFKGASPKIARAQISELQELSYLESGLLKDVVEPALLSMPDDESNAPFFTTGQMIKKYNLESYEIGDVNDPDFITSLIDEKNIDGAVSVRFYPIFKQEIISKLHKNGFLWNLHSGLLPKYKGVFVPYRSIENNEKFYGWTLHHVASEIDTGDIIALDQLPLDPNQPILDTYLDMAEKGAAMTMGALLFYKKRGHVMAKQQSTHQESYFTYPTQAEIQRWTYKGVRFCDDIVQTYLDLYTVPNTPQRQFLRNTLENVMQLTGQSKKAA